MPPDLGVVPSSFTKAQVHAVTAEELYSTFQLPQELQAGVQLVLPFKTDGKGDGGLADYISRFELDEPVQSAYEAMHSCETALICVQNDILRANDEGKVGILLLLDPPAAFDTVDHGTLLDRLHQELAVGGTALDWFECYLADRNKVVSIQGAYSGSRQVHF